MKIMEKVFSDLPEGAPITKEYLDKFINQVAEEFAPFIFHIHNRNSSKNGANEL